MCRRDGVYTAPVIRRTSTGGQAVIEGLSSLEEASALASSRLESPSMTAWPPVLVRLMTGAV
ncbi:hypothetical protein [Thermus scotoductus]|uniref:hypothetical protein n=1 Tax=Thermus scotoductus TaxID=37636 RepID=UPI000F812C8F|nr:hypothetical protein [Thermus scotoductus]RTI23911.1 hypothetical protein CSW20_06470 [Thermus scotoductus]